MTIAQLRHLTSIPIDSTVLAALIGLGGIIIGGLVTGIFAIYQVKRTHRLERLMQEKQHMHERDMLKLQKELEKQQQEDVLEQQKKEKGIEIAKRTMLQAQTIMERINAYKEALRADPSISSLKILDMPSPLKVTNVYVRLRVHREARVSFQFEPFLYEADKILNPDELLRANKISLENRFKTSLDPEEAIKLYKHCVIVGDPGAGKTTLLKYMTIKSIDKHDKSLALLPIHIELNAFAVSKYNNLIDFAAAKWQEDYEFPRSDARNCIVKSLKSGHALLLLDALDETVIGETLEIAEATYTKVTQSITHIATRYHQAFIVVTARKAGYQQRATLAGFTELEILDFQPQDIRQFISNWFTNHSDPLKQANALELNNKLERNPRIQALAANPLLLSLITIVYEAHLDLPDRRAELYRQCVDTLLTKWDASRNIRRRRQFKPEHKLQLLDEIAWHFHSQGRRYFPEEELLGIIGDFLPAVNLSKEQNRGILAEIANENGLLKEQAHGWHGFLHLTLQEYFVAKRVADRNQLGLLLSHWGEPWWEEVILLYAGHTSDASLLLKMLIGYGANAIKQKDIFYSNLLLAGRCLAARPIIRQTNLRQIIIDQLFDVLIETPYSVNKKMLAETLAEIGGHEINKRLISLLVNQKFHSSLSITIAIALGKIGDRSVPSLLSPLLTYKNINPKLREVIAYALGELGDRTVVPFLLGLIPGTNISEDIKIAILKSVGELGEKSTIDTLIQLLADVTITNPVRRQIVLCLGQIGDHEVRPILTQFLFDSSLNPLLRCAAIDAVGMLGESAIVSRLLPIFNAPSTSINIRVHLAQVLGHLGDQAAMPSLQRSLFNQNEDIYVRQACVRALGTMGDRSISSQLIQLLSGRLPDYNLCQSIIGVLVNYGDDNVASQILTIAMNHRANISLCSFMIDALSLFGKRSIVPDLRRWLATEKNPSIRCHLAATAAQLGDSSVITGLLMQLPQPNTDQDTQRCIITALGQVGERKVVPLLLEMFINDKLLHANIQIILADVIGQLAEEESDIQKLTACLNISSLADASHSILWTINRRIGKRIMVTPVLEVPK